MNLQMKTFGKSLLVVIWFYMISVIMSILIGLIYRSEGAYELFIERHSNLLNILIYIIIFCGVCLLDSQKKEFFSSFKSLSLKNVITFMGMGLGAYFIGIIITNLLIGVFPEYNEISNSFNQYEPVLRFIAMVILPPIVEEYLFRFKIQGYLKEGFGTPIAIIGQALLFGMLHYYMLQKIYATVLGLLFGYIREKKENIQCSIWMHMIVNLLGWLAGCFFA